MTATSLEIALPLSPLPEGLFVHALVNRDGVDEYTSQIALQLDGEIDQERLRFACAALMRRHAVLRTSFHQRKSGQTVQLVHKDVAVLITDLDLTAEPESERRSRLRGYLTGERLRGFDLGTAPLIQGRPAGTAADPRGPRAAPDGVEQRLCLLYAEVLGVDQVGIHNGFYELGGDSILSLQLVAKARKAGLLLTPTGVFVHRTVAAMPIVHRLRELGRPVDSFNQSVPLAVPPDVGLAHLVTAAQDLVRRVAADENTLAAGISEHSTRAVARLSPRSGRAHRQTARVVCAAG